MRDKVLVTGFSGFVGMNLLPYLQKYEFSTLGVSVREDQLRFESAHTIVHLAGKAHDFKTMSNYMEYYRANTELTIKIFDYFLKSDASVFIMLSSVKAVIDKINEPLTEVLRPNPITHYGKSKLLAEQYILSKEIPKGKRIYILRPCIIHGPGHKGNLFFLYKLFSKGLPWPLGSFLNLRSYLSVENLCFIIKELIERDDISSGIYNVADDMPLSTNEIIQLIYESKGENVRIINCNKSFISFLALLGDFFNLPLNSERLRKLTENYIVSNSKINTSLGKQLPVSSKEGLKRTFQSFASYV
jgi:nucleoside-diphosphate-sugar epimerase